MMSEKTSLYFLKPNGHFPEGTLFELSDREPVNLPDGGDGNAVQISREILLPCPAFAENVPPGQCGVTVTSISDGDVSGTAVDVTLHHQVIEVPFTAEIEEILSATVIDRLRNSQADRYETAAVDGRYRLHIGHLPPGFYEAVFELPEREPLRMTFIKFFPRQFTDRYTEIQFAGRSSAAPEIVFKPFKSGDPFTDELLNYALKLTTEWGENYGKPINERIVSRFPELSDDEIADLTKLSREAEYYIYSLAEDELEGKIRENQIVPLAREKFAWLDASNAARLAGIGMFYARR